ncbi:hypothetical protein PGQ11_013243 [Apiospora arundinis]|uniref:DUF7918 domain-containing protein n=1 Tax=Apiospora arundinis TaxID=335852 RepID=A0ABR2I4R8_9PEZI
MAVLDNVPGVQVFVRVKGQIATEYPSPDHQQQQLQDTENGCPVVCNYIESFDNRHFAIVTDVGSAYGFFSGGHALSFRVYVDGEYMVNTCTTQDYVWQGCGRRTVSGPMMLDKCGQNLVQQKFKFSAVQTVEDDQRDRVQRDKERAKNLGVIEVRVVRIILRAVSEFQRGAMDRNKDLNLSEKALKGKAISHGAGCERREVVSEPTQTYEADEFPGYHGPIAVYRLLYRSRDALKQELVIPRSPSPTATLDGQRADVSVRGRDRRQELVELRTKYELQLLKIKRELDEVPDFVAQSSQDTRPRTKPRRQEKKVEVVDLTLD